MMCEHVFRDQRTSRTAGMSTSPRTTSPTSTPSATSPPGQRQGLPDAAAARRVGRRAPTAARTRRRWPRRRPRLDRRPDDGGAQQSTGNRDGARSRARASSASPRHVARREPSPPRRAQATIAPAGNFTTNVGATCYAGGLLRCRQGRRRSAGGARQPRPATSSSAGGANIAIRPDGFGLLHPAAGAGRETVGFVALATFANAAGLERVGNRWLGRRTRAPSELATPGQRQGRDGRPAQHRDVDVDLAQEFTGMITSQRGFQANSRVISTSDEMLQDLVTSSAEPSRRGRRHGAVPWGPAGLSPPETAVPITGGDDPSPQARPRAQPFHLNPDLVISVEASPDTVVDAHDRFPPARHRDPGGDRPGRVRVARLGARRHDPRPPPPACPLLAGPRAAGDGAVSSISQAAARTPENPGEPRP